MTEPHELAPLEFSLTAEDITRLWQGEMVERLAEERSESTIDVLEIKLRTKGTTGGETVREAWPDLFEEGEVGGSE